MTDTVNERADDDLREGELLIEMSDVGKAYGAIRASRASTSRSVRARSPACSVTTEPANRP